MAFELIQLVHIANMELHNLSIITWTRMICLLLLPKYILFIINFRTTRRFGSCSD